MLISVVIPAFNEAAYIGETLASLASATTYLQERINVALTQKSETALDVGFAAGVGFAAWAVPRRKRPLSKSGLRPWCGLCTFIWTNAAKGRPRGIAPVQQGRLRRGTAHAAKPTPAAKPRRTPVRTFEAKPINVPVEVIVVDNNSGDSTASVAQDFGATVVKEMQRNIATVRNTGARVASGDVLLFVDGDTMVPENLLCRVVEAMAEPLCCGGAVDTRYQPKRLWSKIYLQIWRIIGKLAGMAQGATQFCRRDVFFALQGYDETLFMGEDVDFYLRLKRFAKRKRSHVVFLEDIQVLPSTRRFDQWKFWRTLIWTNPLFILAFRRRKNVWQGWYREAPR